MRERPILFSAPMVRAILAGTKTQTRRVVKVRDVTLGRSSAPFTGEHFGTDAPEEFCPYGAPGDRLFVKETWRTALDLDKLSPAQIGEKAIDAGYPKPWAPLKYDADHVEVNRFGLRDLGDAWGKTRVSIHMPRWASRLTLEVTGVRVERVQSISKDDAIAEGARFMDYGQHESQLSADGGKTWGTCRQQRAGWSLVETTSHEQCLGSPQMAFANLWIAINGPESWSSNPWVWVVAFRRVEAQERAA